MISKLFFFLPIFMISEFRGNSDLGVNGISFFECKHNNLKLLQILGYVCNTTQPSAVYRDACNGCFFRGISLPNGSPQMFALSQCSTIYFYNSSYRTCSESLATRLVGVQPLKPLDILSCQTGYCDYIRCVRRINVQNLVNSCFTAALVNRDFNRVSDRVTFYTNTTACILAKTRCSDINPITGDLQRQRASLYPPGLTNSAGTAGYFHHNALQIARNGDIKIIAFPSSTVIGNSFCSLNISLDQSPYNMDTCRHS